MTTTELCTCPHCDGTGKLPHYSHIANGDCFACGGTGKIRFSSFIGPNSDIVLEVNTWKGKFSSAYLRCRTWKSYVSPSHGPMKDWGKDKWCKEIDNAEEARRLWKGAKASGIITQLWED